MYLIEIFIKTMIIFAFKKMIKAQHTTQLFIAFSFRFYINKLKSQNNFIKHI